VGVCQIKRRAERRAAMRGLQAFLNFKDLFGNPMPYSLKSRIETQKVISLLANLFVRAAIAFPDGVSAGHRGRIKKNSTI
jgi:hypothetical protein